MEIVVKIKKLTILFKSDDGTAQRELKTSEAKEIIEYLASEVEDFLLNVKEGWDLDIWEKLEKLSRPFVPPQYEWEGITWEAKTEVRG